MVFLQKKSIFRDKNEINHNGLLSTIVDSPNISINQSDEIDILIEKLPEAVEINSDNLFEIKNQTTIARISSTIPVAAQLASKAITENFLANTELYSATIPSGAILTKSKEISGAFRGYFHGGKGIKGQANLIKEDFSKFSKSINVASIMNVAFLVVGQYYMSSVDSKLDTITQEINKINDFQNREFKSRILSLATRVREISQFSVKIIENKEQRNIKLTILEDLKGLASELLGQVNITIDETVQKNFNLNYQEYLKTIDDFTLLIGYQNILMNILEEIGKLTYFLGDGDVSSEMSLLIFEKYSEQSIKTRENLGRWHELQIQNLRIDLDKKRITKKGIESFIWTVPGLVKSDFKYKELNEELLKKINDQMQRELDVSESNDFRSENVQIIIKDGKYYYLHESSQNPSSTVNWKVITE